jgi:hypothetical protein
MTLMFSSSFEYPRPCAVQPTIVPSILEYSRLWVERTLQARNNGFRRGDRRPTHECHRQLLNELRGIQFHLDGELVTLSLATANSPINEKLPQRRTLRRTLMNIPDGFGARLRSRRQAVDYKLHRSVAEPVIVEYISKNIHSKTVVLRFFDVFYFHVDSRIVDPVSVQPKVIGRNLRQSYDLRLATALRAGGSEELGSRTDEGVVDYEPFLFRTNEDRRSGVIVKARPGISSSDRSLGLIKQK